MNAGLPLAPRRRLGHDFQRSVALPAAALIAAIGLMVFASPYYVSLFDYIGIYSLVCIGLVLLTGVAGLTSFGQAAFVGIGAYTSAYFTTRQGLNPWAALPLVFLVTGVSAALIGRLTLSLSGHYLSLVTLAWGISLYYLFGNLQVLGGHGGLTDLPALSLAGVDLASPRHFLPFVWILVLVNVLLIRNLLNSRPGRAIRALSRDPVMAESNGINTGRYKRVVFLYAALLAGLAGWLYAHMQCFINPTPFGPDMGIEFLFMVVIGGAGDVWGGLIGATLLTVGRAWLQAVLPELLGQSGNYEGIVFGLLVLLVLQWARQGAWPLLKQRLPTSQRNPAPVRAGRLPCRDRPPAGTPLLDVDGVTKRFGGLVAVNGIGFSVGAGEIVGLLGPNGAGKSTLFNTISGSLPADDGTIRFLGERIDRRRPRDILARGIGRTFQHVQLLPAMSTLENVALGAFSRTRSGLFAAMLHLDRVEEKSALAEAAFQLQRVGLSDDQHRPVGSLPLGKQRIVEIARALASDPLLLLLDEPAAGLRHGEKEALAELLAQLRREGMSVLLVEHDMGFVMPLADRLVAMEFGEKIAEGTPAAVRTDAAVLEAYLGGVE